MEDQAVEEIEDFFIRFTLDSIIKNRFETQNAESQSVVNIEDDDKEIEAEEEPEGRQTPRGIIEVHKKIA